MTKYLVGICIILAILCYSQWQRGQTYKALYKGEQEKVAQRDATIKDQVTMADKQRKADKKTIESYQKLLKECQDNQPVCPPTIINCEDDKCNVIIKPTEAPF